MQILMERVAGKSIPELAAQYNIPRREIEALTQEGWESAVVESLKVQMIEKLSPMVMAVYEQQLRLGSLEAARDIGMTIGLLRKEKTLTVKPPLAQEPRAVNSVEDYRLARQSRKYRAPDLLEDALPPASPRKISVE